MSLAAMRAWAAVGIVLLSTPTVGCTKKDDQAQCLTAITALGVGSENVELPINEASQKAQLERMSVAIEAWRTSKGTVTLPLVRPKADAVATAVTERHATLRSATFAPLPSPPISSSSAAARQAALDEQAKTMLGIPTSTLDPASHASLTANRTAYRVAFERLTQVCSKM